MRGDFSRDSFNERAGFSGVLKLQGRVQLDADDNENLAILLHHLRTLAMDVIGKHGGPGGESIGIEVQFHGTVTNFDFAITPGRYYVEGLLCENWEFFAYRGIDDLPAPCQPWCRPPEPPKANETYIAYLEVWERSLSAAENDPSRPIATPGMLREVALAGVDSADRQQLLWRVRLGAAPQGRQLPARNDDSRQGDAIWAEWVRFWHGQPRGNMRAQIHEQSGDDSNPCVISPRAAYRGLENQLYRIEICRGGRADAGAEGATFVWSRNNAGTAFAVETVSGNEVRLAETWRDERSAIGTGDFVELSDPYTRLEPGPGPIYRVMHYDPDSATLTLDKPPEIQAASATAGVVLRPWDHVERKPSTGVPPIANDNALTLIEGRPLTIEDGIEIWFDSNATTGLPVYEYRKGDYWIFEARVDLGRIVWPRAGSQPRLMPPHGVRYHYAPLAVIKFGANGEPQLITDTRRVID